MKSFLFLLTDMVKYAQKPTAKLLGRVSLELIEILEGLEIGDLTQIRIADFSFEARLHAPSGAKSQDLFKRPDQFLKGLTRASPSLSQELSESLFFFGGKPGHRGRPPLPWATSVRKGLKSKYGIIRANGQMFRSCNDLTWYKRPRLCY
jgi:hypothetical protein